MSLIVIFASYRTGGTAFSQVFQNLGFSVIHDPFSPWLKEENVKKYTSTEILRHPPGLTYFEWFPESLTLPVFIQAPSEKVSPDEKKVQVEKYLDELLVLKGWPAENVVIKIEQLALYNLVAEALPGATFLGLERARKSQEASFERLWQAGVQAFYKEALRNLKEIRGRFSPLIGLDAALLRFSIIRALTFRTHYKKNRSMLRKLGIPTLDVSPEGNFELNRQALTRLPPDERSIVGKALVLARLRRSRVDC